MGAKIAQLGTLSCHFAQLAISEVDLEKAIWFRAPLKTGTQKRKNVTLRSFFTEGTSLGVP